MTEPSLDAGRRPLAIGAAAPVSATRKDQFAARYGVLITTLIAIACLGVWWLSPIYSDEIAFRQQLGRTISDRGVVYGLYELCESNIKTVPFVMKPAAWALSSVMQALSPLEMRVLSFSAVIGVIAMTARLASGARNPAAAFITLASFAGVAGSGLIFARYELGLEVHLLSCLVAAGLVMRAKTSVVLDVLVAVGLIACATFSVFCHIQGLILLPLTAYLLQKIAVRRFGAVGFGAAAIPFALLLYPTLTLHRSVCAEYPEIEVFWRKMAFDPESFSLAGSLGWLLDKWWLHARNFEYAVEFPARFLPGIPEQGTFVSALNAVVQIVVGLTGLALAAVLILTPILVLSASRSRNLIRASKALDTSGFLLMLSFLIGVPAAFLFIYDSAHNFYRSFYVHHLAIVAITLAVAAIPWRLSSGAVKGAAASLTVFASVSMLANAILVAPPLWAGYEGPSLSIFRNWSATKRDVERLAAQCGADLSRGRIIVDDLTQAAVFSRPVTFPWTYLSLQASITGLSVDEALRRARPNYAILQCRNSDLLKLNPQARLNGLCCSNFGVSGN